MHIVTISIPNSDLASRTSAARLRSEIEANFGSGTVVCLNLTAVENLSESYADELFGVLVERYTLQTVFSRLRIVGSRPPVVRSITQALRYRLERRQSAKGTPIEGVVREALKRQQEAFA